MPQQQFGTRPQVRLDGQPLPPEHEPLLITVDIEADLTAPGRCVLTFSDPGRSVLDDLGVDLDQKVEVRASAVEETEERPLFTGSVYGLDIETDASGSRAYVRAYDDCQKLRQRRQVKSWNQVTDADLVRELAGDAGVTVGEVDAAGVLHPYIAQLNQTHWEFLSDRARRTGRVVHVADGKLRYAPVAQAAGGPATGGYQSADPLELIPGHNALYLRGGVAAAAQVGEIEARGWDPQSKREVVAATRPESRAASGRTTAADVGGSIGTRSQVVAAPGLADPAAVDDLARAVGRAVAGAYSYLEVGAVGDPRLRAGVVVSLGECGRLDGAYTITSARHRFDRDGYHTELQLSDRHDRSLYGLIGPSPGAERPPGARPAIVTNVEDPDRLGRVKLKYPWLSDDFETGWSRVVQVGAGPERGLLWYPEVGDEVLVDYLDADETLPVVVGGMFNGSDAAPFSGLDDQGDGKIDKRGMRTRVGHEVYLDDTAGEERIEIRTGNGKVSVRLDQAGRKIVIDCDGEVEITSTGDTSVRSQGNVTVEAQGNATFKAGGNLNIEAGGRVAVSGSMIALN